MNTSKNTISKNAISKNISNSNIVSKNNSSKVNVKNKLETFIKTGESSIRYSKDRYNKLKNIIQETPLLVKILNVLVPFSITYYFTLIYYKLSISIIFAIITFFVISLLSVTLAVSFIILYIIVVVQISNNRTKNVRKSFEETDIEINNKPFNCVNNSLTISNKRILKDLTGGYFSYSYWLYINGNDNSLSESNWNNFRNDEWKLILYRGNEMTDNLDNLIQYPGFWLTPKLNNLIIVFQNGNMVERIEIDNIEFNKWLNIVVVVELKSISVYVNGLLEVSVNLHKTIPQMNTYNLYVSNDKNNSKDPKVYGFPGSIAQLTYYNYTLKPSDINKLYNNYNNIINKYQNNLILSKVKNIKYNLIKNDNKLKE
jgi:hypothetical protein